MSINPVSVPAGSPPDPLTEQKTFDVLAARGFVSTGEDFLARESFDKKSLAWMKTFRASGKAGVVSMLHAEDWSIMAEAQERLMIENGGGGGTLHNFAQSAPIVAEVLAVRRGMAVAEATGSPIYQVAEICIGGAVSCDCKDCRPVTVSGSACVDSIMGNVALVMGTPRVASAAV